MRNFVRGTSNCQFLFRKWLRLCDDTLGWHLSKNFKEAVVVERCISELFSSVCKKSVCLVMAAVCLDHVYVKKWTMNSHLVVMSCWHLGLNSETWVQWISGHNFMTSCCKWQRCTLDSQRHMEPFHCRIDCRSNQPQHHDIMSKSGGGYSSINSPVLILRGTVSGNRGQFLQIYKLDSKYL